MDRVLQVKKKGFNDDPRYAEFYLHNALQNFGYYLTRDETTADFVVTAYIDHRTKYILFTSPFFDLLKDDELLSYTEAIAIAMKSTAAFIPRLNEIKTQGVATYHFLYSSTTNAYLEPATIENGSTLLECSSRSVGFGRLGLKITNYGGPSRGMDIIIDAPLLTSVFMKIEDAQIRRYTKGGMLTEKLIFQKKHSQYICRLNDFLIHPGLNKKSALWSRTRTKYQDTEFYMDLSLAASAPITGNIVLTVKPHFGSGFSINLT